MKEILAYTVYHNTVSDWATAVGTMILYFFGISLLKRILARRMERHLQTSTAIWHDAIARILRGTRRSTVLVVSAYAAVQILALPPRADLWTTRLTFLVCLVQVLTWGTSLIDITTEQYLKTPGTFDGARTTSVRAISFLARFLFFAVLVLWGLDNLGVNITTLVAGLGVGGVAIALAVQNILGDLFASLTIVLDKPFVLGDTISVAEFEGTVEYIGLKTTRLRSATGEQLVFPNGGLLQSRIRNLKRMQERRGLFILGVTYQTDAAKLRAIPGIVKSVIEAQPDTRFMRAHFKTFNASSLDFEVLYWMTDTDYLKYMNTQQAINFALFDRFQKEGIEFAYPTQTLFIEKNAPTS